MEKKTIRLPSIEYLEMFRSELLGCMDDEKVRRMIDWFIQYYKPLNIRASYKQPYWRARKCNTPEGYSSVSEMLAPPSEIAKAGRMNDAGAPLLYLSATVETAFAELHAIEGDLIQVVGVSEISPPRILLVGEMLDTFRGIARYTNSIDDKIRKFIHDMPLKARQIFIYMDALAAEIFRDTKAADREYLHSRSLSRALLEKIPDLDGIAYPSIALTDSANVALKPIVTESMYAIGHCSVVRITQRHTYGFYDIETLREAIGQDDNGNFEWK